MKIKKNFYSITRKNPRLVEYIRVDSDIHFDNFGAFCGKPYMILVAVKDNPIVSWRKYSIGIRLRDQDDFDIGYVYYPTEDQFFDILHELINWMHDLEMGLCLWDKFVDDISGFFPKLDCKRERW